MRIIGDVSREANLNGINFVVVSCVANFWRKKPGPIEIMIVLSSREADIVIATIKLIGPGCYLD